MCVFEVLGQFVSLVIMFMQNFTTNHGTMDNSWLKGTLQHKYKFGLTLSDLGSEIATKPWGGAKHHPLEINKGVLLDPMLKNIKMVITCKK